MNAPSKAIPKPTPETQRYWDAAAQGRLDLPHCNSCDEAFFYPRSSCPKCGSVDIGWITASGKATLHSYVISHRPAPGFQAPVVIAVVQTEEGTRMMTNIVGVEPDPQALQLDMPLQVDFEDRDGVAIPVFRPATDGGER